MMPSRAPKASSTQQHAAADRGLHGGSRARGARAGWQALLLLLLLLLLLPRLLLLLLLVLLLLLPRLLRPRLLLPRWVAAAQGCQGCQGSAPGCC